MLHGFGQAPVCLELDLDSYDGPCTHVERFRGRAGWLAVAEAVLSGFGGERTTTLIAACDDRGEVFPTWQAEKLFACACSRPIECDDYPPVDLEALLDDAAGELATRWVRENSQSLRAMAARTVEQIAALEASARVAVDEADCRDALLRRRRRMTSPGSEAWTVLTEAMTAIGLDREALLHHLAERRAAVRREMAVADNAAMSDADVAVEWELLYQVRWSATGRVGEDAASVRHLWAGRPAGSSGGARSPAARHYREAARQAESAAARQKAVADARAAALKSATQAKTPPSPPASKPATVPSPPITVVAPTACVSPPTPVVNVTSCEAAPPVNAKLTIERDLLARQLVEAETTRRKLLPGSPKYARNHAERADLSERIRELTIQIKGAQDVIAAAEPSLVDQRAELHAELRRHERRGAMSSDGVNRYGVYCDRRLHLLGRIAELDARIARETRREQRA